MTERASAHSTVSVYGTAGKKWSGRRPLSAAVFVVAALGIAFFPAGNANAQATERAKALHKVCEAALGAAGVTIVTDSDTECVFRATVGYGSATYYNYFSGENFCERTVVITPDFPKYDRTVCSPAPIPADIKPGTLTDEQAKILAPLEGAQEAIRVVGEEVDYVEGSVQLLRDGGTVPITSKLPVEPGDVVLTGKTGFVEIISDGGATWLSGDSTYGIAEIGPTEKPRVIAPDEPLDPQSFQLEELPWWKKVGLYFAGTYNPDVYKTAEMYGIKKAHIVYRGAAYFEENTDGSVRPATVITPTAAIMPNGTTFLVEVEKDGATTVTTLDGQVVVADLKSGKVVSVNENQAVTVPKTLRGLSAKELQQGVSARFLTPIDRWWFEKISKKAQLAAASAAEAGNRDNEADDFKNKMFFASLAAVLVVGGIVGSVIRSRASKKK